MEIYTAETAPCIQRNLIGYQAPFATRSYGSSPCDGYGNPINPDGTIQMYVHVSYANEYPVKNYRIGRFDSFNKYLMHKTS